MLFRVLAVAPFALLASACSLRSTAVPQRSVSEVGAFTITKSIDRFTQRTAPAASTFDRKRNGMLGFWCLESGLAVLVGLTPQLATNPTGVSVRFRFDDGAASAQQLWLVQRQNGYPLAYTHPSRVESFTRNALRSDTVRFEVFNPSNRAVAVYEFSLAGLARASSELPCLPREWTDAPGSAG